VVEEEAEVQHLIVEEQEDLEEVEMEETLLLVSRRSRKYSAS
jgi:hypothetical protein